MASEEQEIRMYSEPKGKYMQWALRQPFDCTYDGQPVVLNEGFTFLPESGFLWKGRIEVAGHHMEAFLPDPDILPGLLDVWEPYAQYVGHLADMATRMRMLTRPLYDVVQVRQAHVDMAMLVRSVRHDIPVPVFTQGADSDDLLSALQLYSFDWRWLARSALNYVPQEMAAILKLGIRPSRTPDFLKLTVCDDNLHIFLDDIEQLDVENYHPKRDIAVMHAEIDGMMAQLPSVLINSIPDSAKMGSAEFIQEALDIHGNSLTAKYLRHMAEAAKLAINQVCLPLD